jgi:hypothetical protein
VVEEEGLMAGGSLNPPAWGHSAGALTCLCTGCCSALPCADLEVIAVSQPRRPVLDEHGWLQYLGWMAA